MDRPFIQMFCCLFDIRREIEDFEWAFLKNLSQKNSRLALILTKSDKISFAEQKRKIAFMEEQLKVRHISCPFGVFGVSNLNKKCIDDLRQIFFQS